MTPDNAPAPAPAPATAEVTVGSSIRQEIIDRLAVSGPAIREAIVGDLAKKEIDKRKSALMSVFDKLETKQAELKKLENGGTFTYNAAGEKTDAEPTFTKQQIETLKKTREFIGRLQGALTKALTSNDYSQAFKLEKGGEPQEEKKSADAPDGE